VIVLDTDETPSAHQIQPEKTYWRAHK